MKNKIDDKIKNIMATVFKTSVQEISDDSTPHSIKSWGSLKHINLIIALEEEFDLKLEEDEIAAMVSFPIISATIQAYLN